VKSLARVLLLALVLGLFGFAAANNFWRPDVDGGFCTTGPGPQRCHSICDNTALNTALYHTPPLEQCHVITSGAETILIVGGAGIIVLAAVSASPRRKKPAKPVDTLTV